MLVGRGRWTGPHSDDRRQEHSCSCAQNIPSGRTRPLSGGSVSPLAITTVWRPQLDAALMELALCASLPIDGVCALKREMDVNKVWIPPSVRIGTGHRFSPTARVED